MDSFFNEKEKIYSSANDKNTFSLIKGEMVAEKIDPQIFSISVIREVLKYNPLLFTLAVALILKRL